MADEVKEVDEIEENEELEEKHETPEHLKELEKEIKEVVKEEKGEEEEEEDKKGKDKTPPEDTEEKDDKGKPEGEKGDEKDSIPNALKERAVKVDMTLDELDTYSDLAMLEKYVALKEEVLAGKSEEGGASEDEEGKKFEQTLNEIFDFNEGENEDGEKWDPELVERFGKMKDLFVGMKKTNDEQGKLIEDIQGSGYSGNDFLNSKITGLGKPYEDLFGKDGSISDDQQKARDKVSQHIDTFTEAAEKVGETISKDEAFKRAINGLHSDKALKEEGKKISKLAKDRAKRAIDAPRGDGGMFLKDGDKEPASLEEKAEKALEEKYG